MENIITPQEVVQIAFADAQPFDPDQVTVETIIVAQQKFIVPVLGQSLYGNLSQYPQLVEDYIKQPLATYVKLVMLPSLAVNIGAMGVVQHRSTNFVAATEKQIAALRKRTRNSANTLMLRAVEHIEASPELYPEYDPRQNILHKTRIQGDIVL